MSKARYPLLDILRAAAILLVVMHHFRNISGAPKWFHWVFMRGYIGVDIFFVLSGYLIGAQALQSIRQQGNLDVRRFLLRRWLRTLPSYYTLMLAMLASGAVAQNRALIMGFSLQNYLAPQDWLISWSLCVEEHFYLILPLLLFCLLRFIPSSMLTRDKLTVFCISCIAISPIWRVVEYLSTPARTFDWYMYDLSVQTQFRLDGLALGVGLAAAKLWDTTVWKWLAQNATALGWLGLALLTIPWHPWFSGTGSGIETRLMFLPAVIQPTIVSIATLLLIVAGVAKSRFSTFGIIGALFFSELAYTLYLTHMEGLVLVRTITRSHELPFLMALPLACLVSIVWAMLLRKFVEIPGLKLRSKLA